jgi:DNA-binding NarL/FixJ family response regulator
VTKTLATLALVSMIGALAITVSIVEDDRAARESLMALLEGEPGQNRLRCVGCYSTGEAALKGIPVDRPNVALVDIKLPGMNGIECVARLRARMPDLHVLMLTTFDDGDLIFESLRAGARGYLLKKMISADLVDAVEQVHAGGAPMSMQVARQVVDHFHRQRDVAPEIERLTSREQEILALLARGKLYKEIGDHLSISISTVRAHLRNIYEKLHVRSRTEATAVFFERNR